MLMPSGGCAWKPELMSGVTIMKMINNTSMTSINGVTLGSALTAPLDPVDDIAMTRLRGGVELAGEPRPAELAGHTLDQVVDHFLRCVRHLDGQVVDLGREVVEEPHRRNGDDEAEGRRDERL